MYALLKMALFNATQRKFAESLDRLVHENPFSSDRLQLEKRALGSEFQGSHDAWSAGPGHLNPNIEPLLKKVSKLVEQSAARWGEANDKEAELFASLMRFKLYYEHEEEHHALSVQARQGRLRKTPNRGYTSFRQSYESVLGEQSARAGLIAPPAHLWALSFQLRRAFAEIFRGIVGTSTPARRLRAQIWESVFTHDMRRYERSLFARMHEINTLIVGPSGTGKEVVARSIGLSRYIPFEEESGRFLEETAGTFLPLNITALSETLVESELFGHKKGSFTGASSDREGIVEACPEHGTLFLDEIGELNEALQVKLLRLLQEREFSRIGEHKSRSFSGKLVAATNRDLASAVSEGEFRADFFFRLRGDAITTPSLEEQLSDAPGDLARMVSALAHRIAPAHEVEELGVQVCRFVEEQLPHYSWPGNVRELDQCIRSVLVRGSYEPARITTPSNRSPALQGAPTIVEAKNTSLERLLADETTLEQVGDLYCALGHERYGSFSEAARRLDVDRRTIKARVESARERLS